MTMQLFLLNLALNTLTIAIPVFGAVYLAVRFSTKNATDSLAVTMTLLREEAIKLERRKEEITDFIKEMRANREGK